MTEGAQIRLLLPEDFQIYKELRFEGVKNHPTAFGGSFEEESVRSDERWRSSLSASHIYGAFIAEKIVGCLGYYTFEAEKMKHRANIFGMYIRPEARGKGVGKLLIEHICAHCVDSVLQFHLTVETTNYSAINLYLKCGFRIYGTEPRSLKIGDNFYDEYLMVKYKQ